MSLRASHILLVGMAILIVQKITLWLRMMMKERAFARTHRSAVEVLGLRLIIWIAKPHWFSGATTTRYDNEHKPPVTTFSIYFCSFTYGLGGKLCWFEPGSAGWGWAHSWVFGQLLDWLGQADCEWSQLRRPLSVPRDLSASSMPAWACSLRMTGVHGQEPECAVLGAYLSHGHIHLIRQHKVECRVECAGKNSQA